jgi:hypothetical protein
LVTKRGDIKMNIYDKVDLMYDMNASKTKKAFEIIKTFSYNKDTFKDKFREYYPKMSTVACNSLFEIISDGIKVNYRTNG